VKETHDAHHRLVRRDGTLRDPNGHCLATEDVPEIVSIQCDHWGMFGRGHSWELKVNGEGRAVLTVQQPRKDIVRRFTMKERLRLIEKEIIAQKFFDLPKDIGRLVSDGSTRTLTIKTRRREKTITIRYVSAVEAPLTEDEVRALRIWDTVRSSFDEKEAADSRPYDRPLLESWGKRRK
jgi:hypothetical protein